MFAQRWMVALPWIVLLAVLYACSAALLPALAALLPGRWALAAAGRSPRGGGGGSSAAGGLVGGGGGGPTADASAEVVLRLAVGGSGGASGGVGGGAGGGSGHGPVEDTRRVFPRFFTAKTLLAGYSIVGLATAATILIVPSEVGTGARVGVGCVAGRRVSTGEQDCAGKGFIGCWQVSTRGRIAETVAAGCCSTHPHLVPLRPPARSPPGGPPVRLDPVVRVGLHVPGGGLRCLPAPLLPLGAARGAPPGAAAQGVGMVDVGAGGPWCRLCADGDQIQWDEWEVRFTMPLSLWTSARTPVGAHVVGRAGQVTQLVTAMPVNLRQPQAQHR